MRFAADLHIHSHYSIATSKKLDPPNLDFWARIKGITVVGTGDCTHPGWLSELQQCLAPAEQGLFRLKPGLRLDGNGSLSGTGSGVRTAVPEQTVRFLLSAEISSIYKYDGRVRKVHNLVLLPGFESARALQERLSKIGNITSDGRPILGLDARDLVEIVLECSEHCLVIPSHIWTPWFSAMGGKSGFDSIDQCYRDMAPHITAVETGLSSDPPMNWRCSFLDRFTLISNSDAHSPEKLGREANLFDTDLTYGAMVRALQHGESGFAGTVEYFPQEGKYHCAGHRKCGIRLDPESCRRAGGICPQCGRPVTLGVLDRVDQLSDRSDSHRPAKARAFHSLVPLKEILSELTGTGAGSKKVGRVYHDLVGRAGSELRILMHLETGDVAALGGELLAEAIRRMRTGEVYVEGGFDGQYGVVRMFAPGEIDPAAHAQERS